MSIQNMNRLPYPKGAPFLWNIQREKEGMWQGKEEVDGGVMTFLDSRPGVLPEMQYAFDLFVWNAFDL